MIPKVIHYCWFGNGEIPEKEQQCIASWKKWCPDYKIVRWDESNYDVNAIPYTRDAYKEKKWSFVSDYARVVIIYHHGGIYLDTDVELLKPLDDYLNDGMFCGFESRDPLMDRNGIKYENSVNFGLGFGAEAGNIILKDLLDLYKTLSFYKEDGSLNLMACPHYQTNVLMQHGLKDDRSYQKLENCVVYPEDYFSPKSYLTGQITVTENTVSIHHFRVSWTDDAGRKDLELQWHYCQKYGYTVMRIIMKLRRMFKIK